MQVPRFFLIAKGQPGGVVSVDCTGQVGAQILDARRTGHVRGQQPLASKPHRSQVAGGLQFDCRQESAAAQAAAFTEVQC